MYRDDGRGGAGGVGRAVVVQSRTVEHVEPDSEQADVSRRNKQAEGGREASGRASRGVYQTHGLACTKEHRGFLRRQSETKYNVY